MEKIGLVEVGVSELNFVFVLLHFLCWLIYLVIEACNQGIRFLLICVFEMDFLSALLARGVHWGRFIRVKHEQ